MAVQVMSLSNKSRKDQTGLKEFVDFHWTHHRSAPRYVPLLDFSAVKTRTDLSQDKTVTPPRIFSRVT
jgi:hypothetical protein